jgi:opacity protein-like surface antigen
VGAGLEAALATNWTAKVEYLYVDLGSFNCGLNCEAGLVNRQRVVPHQSPARRREL